MNLIHDLRLAWRRLAKAPAFTALVVFTLGLGIAATTTLFAVFETVVLRPLPYRDADRLVRLYETFPWSGGEPGRGSVSPGNFQDWTAETQTFAGMAGYTYGSATLQEGDAPERVATVSGTASLFDVLGVSARLGRTFAAGDDAVGAPPVVVLSHALWQRRFAGDRQILGRTLRLDGQAHQVVGVMPARFAFPAGVSDTEVWVPLVITPEQVESRGWHWMSVVARLADGVPRETAEADLKRVAALLEQRHPDAQESRSAVVDPLHEVVVGDVRPMLTILLGAAALVLVIAWANAANLQLVRASGRRRELATRAALGAGRARIVVVFLTEALLLAAGGALLGLGLAVAALRALQAGAADLLPRAAELAVQPLVFVFLALLTLATALACGLVPALQATRGVLHDELKEGGRGGSVRSGQSFRRGLVVAQVALSVVLLVGTGLLVRTLGALLAVDTGFRTAGVLTAQLSASGIEENDNPATQLFGPVLERVRALPGVEAAGGINLLPLAVWGHNGNFFVDGRPPAATLSEEPFAEWRSVSPGYFAALGIPLLQGRDFGAGDTAQAPAVIVNQALADRYFPDDEVVGQVLLLGGRTPENAHRVVGVVGNVRQASLDLEPLPELYRPFDVEPPSSLTLVVRATGSPETLAAAIAAVVREVDPGQPLYDVATMDRVVASSVADRRLFLGILSGFAFVALALAMAGIYGVVSFAVSSRTREIGIRMALGASGGRVRGLVLSQAGTLVLLGILVGVPAALLLSRFLTTLLYGVEPADGPTLAFVALLLALVALVASWLPARRATRIQPMTALRVE